MDIDSEKAFRLTELSRLELLESKSCDYVRYLASLGVTGSRTAACERFLARWPKGLGALEIQREVEVGHKAAIAPGTTGGTTWAAPLVGVSALAEGFIKIVRSSSLFGKLPLRQVPFNTKCPIESGAATYIWVAEGKPKPISSMAFNDGITLAPLKSVGVVVLAKEFLFLSQAGTEIALRDTLRAGLVAFQDLSFLSPTSTAIAGARPASVTAGTTPIANTGVLATDLQSLLNAFFTARPNASGDTTLIAGAAKAAQIRSLNGGGGVGLPVVVSEAAGGTIVCLDPAGVFFADGGVDIRTSESSALQMSDTPDDPTTANTVSVSLFQVNAVAYRVERFLNFAAVTGAVKYVAA